MRRLYYFIFIVAIISTQEKKEITILANFKDLEQVTISDFYLAWELPVIADNQQSYYQFKSINDDNYLLFDQLLSNPTHSVLFISFDNSKTNIDMVATFKSGKQGVFKRKPLLWLGLQEIETSYQFVKKLMTEIDADDKLFSLLNAHQKNDETLAFYSKRYKTANSNRIRKNLIFWIGAIHTEKAAKELDSILESNISVELKKQVMFAYSRNRSTYAMKRLIAVSKDGQYGRAVQKKAKFWLASAAGSLMEKQFNKEIYEGDELEVRTSAVFALYNMKDYSGLKQIAMNAKDIRLRKKALFWLGQIEQTPISFFESILSL